MKQIKILSFIICLLMILSTCKKEIEYPTSIIGKWKYLGVSNSSVYIYEGADPSLSIMDITQDSMFFFEGNLNKPVERYKIELIDNYTDRSGVTTHQHVIYTEMIYRIPDFRTIDLSLYRAYEIKKDILILEILNESPMCFYEFYRVYPND